ncbi:MAG: deoxyguanosinetriphosphate triphosphohydrolase [candidate division Zixibacteria bacterium]|nr:deoxyguanosinetriphosphate triphosphohydrolase [candidate division Zixibacteria bacterium]
MNTFNEIRAGMNEREETHLAPYAMKSRETKGRKYKEEDHPYRSCFQRDRDRIIHSTAFRRLEYKTQVFVNHEGDHYRTRLTHTIEVAQISRSLARALRLNEDLTEAIALAHDLGHTPFGHSGEETLSEIMKTHGGFEHNRQSLRAVDLLEERYPEFPGLNLTYEVREGIIKHETVYDKPVPAEFNPRHCPTLECQVVNLADEIAYTSHDIDDGLRSQVLSESELNEAELWRKTIEEIKNRYGDLPSYQKYSQAVRMIINQEVTNAIKETNARLLKYQIKSVDEVRALGENLLSFSTELKKLNSQMKILLFNKMYRHYRMIRMADKAKRIISQLFEVYQNNPDQLPPNTREKLKDIDKMQVICDYIAGMTDRFALQEYRKLFDPMERV